MERIPMRGFVSIDGAAGRDVAGNPDMLVAAMNPCRCGHAYEPGYACKRGRIDRCTADYQTRIPDLSWIESICGSRSRP